MSFYTVTGLAPCIASQIGESNDVTIVNTGSLPCYVSETPGIPTYGFLLPPGGTKIWPARTPIYIQCGTSTDVTTVNVSENSGEYYAPAPLNLPSILWDTESAPAPNGSAPSGGSGDLLLITGSNRITRVLNVTNYNSIVINLLEFGLNGADYEMRDVTVTWFDYTDSGIARQVYRQNYKYYTISSDTVPQLQMHLPTRGQLVTVELGPVTFAAPVAPVNIVSMLVVGDSRVLVRPIVRNLARYHFINENFTVGPQFLDADLCIDNHCTGVISVAAGATVNYSFSTISGAVNMLARVNTSAALVENTRVQIVDRFSLDLIMATQFIIGRTGVTFDQQNGYLTPSPMKIQLTNSQATATQFFFALKFEEI